MIRNIIFILIFGLVLGDNIERKPLANDLYIGDPSAQIFNGKIYIYPSHDQDQEVEEKDNGEKYDMINYHVFEISDIEHSTLSKRSRKCIKC